MIEGEITAAAVPGKVELSWNRAERSADGQRLYDLAAFVVERAEASGNSEEPGAFTQVARIDVVDQERIRRRSRFRYEDTPPAGASVLWYRVHAVAADGEQGPPTPSVRVPVAQ